MNQTPETHYAKNGNVHIAYQTVGDGEVDLAVVPEWVTHVEAAWDEPMTARFLRRLATFGRLILFDKRGIGLSDPVPVTEAPSLEAWGDDLAAVLDAVGSKRAVLLGHGHGGQMALFFAATRPERAESLVLLNAYARLGKAPGYEWGIPLGVQDQVTAATETFWGRSNSPTLDLIAPSVAHLEGLREWWARLERLACSPGTAVAMQTAILNFDVRHILSSISTPTLVVQSASDRFVRAGHGRYLAENIRDARYLEIASKDHWPWVGETAPQVLTAIHEFVTGVPYAHPADRVLTTVLLTDIVDSTGRAARIGDRAWRDVLEDLDAMMARQVARFEGRIVNTTGDGYLAVFDGPGRAIRCADAIREAVRSLDLEVRTGLHCGEVDLRDQDVSGIAVHIAARVMALAGAGDVLISGSIPPLVAGSGFEFGDKGEHELRGVPGKWHIYALDN